MHPLLLRFSHIFLGLFLVLGACTERPGVQEEYARIKEAASRLSGASVYVVQADSSYIDWLVYQQNGPSLKGKFRPGKGSVVVEKSSIIAGFLEGDLWDGNVPDTSSHSVSLAKEKKALIRQFPVLSTQTGRNIRLDLTQSERSVSRSDFRQNTGLPDDSLPGYSFLANLEMADSLVSVKLPFRQKIQKNTLVLDGEYTLNAQDFTGVLPNGASSAQFPWNLQIPLRFHLVFTLLK